MGCAPNVAIHIHGMRQTAFMTGIGCNYSVLKKMCRVKIMTFRSEKCPICDSLIDVVEIGVDGECPICGNLYSWENISWREDWNAIMMSFDCNFADIDEHCTELSCPRLELCRAAEEARNKEN